MKKVVLYINKQHCWCVGIVVILKDDTPIDMYPINRFYEVSDNFLSIYDEVGGSGTGYSRGNLIHKISLKDCEFETKELTNEIDSNLQKLRMKLKPGDYI